MKFILQSIFSFSPSAIECRVPAKPGYCETAPTECDSLASAVPFLGLELSVCQPSVWDAARGHREGGGGGGEEEEEEKVEGEEEEGGMTFAESLSSQRWRGWVTACLDSMQNVPRLYVGADTVAAARTDIYRRRGALWCCYDVFTAVLE